jgi:hypothetical protein
MVGGRFLSADHSHKFAKVVLIQGNRGFEGLYTVMNEFGKILGWWFVNGTTLREVESSLRGINRRYMLHGFQGPLAFTTDRCCDERETIAGNNNAEQKPIFASFEKANNDANNANANVTMDTSEDGNFTRAKRDNSGVSVKRRKQNDAGIPKASKAPYRCRPCGHSYGRGQPYAQHHVGGGDPGQARRAREKGTEQLQYLKPNQVCNVPEQSREPGFPVNQGETMPRRKRVRKRSKKK